MHKFLLLLCCCSVLFAATSVWPNPYKYSSSQQEPQTCIQEIDFILQAPHVATECASILNRAFTRYQKIIFSMPPTRPIAKIQTLQLRVEIIVKNDTCETDVMHEMDEYYAMEHVQANLVSISANSVWGALRALESLSQVIVPQHDAKSLTWQFCVTPFSIVDYPKTKWRGLLIDVARHYLPVTTLRGILNAMEADKYNVMHLHLVDAQSFPLQINGTIVKPWDPVFGAYYTQQELRELVLFAKDRGIRIVPEIDVPGHAASWSGFGPNITAYCPSFFANINNIPLNPIRDETYRVVKQVFDYVKDTFADKYIHIGGDELVKNCWLSDPSISHFIDHNPYGIQNTDDLWGYFQARMWKDNFASTNKIAICWEELAMLKTHLYSIDKSQVLVQVWRDASTLASMVQQGFHSLFSADFYVDRQKPVPSAPNRFIYVDTWKDMYSVNIMDQIPLQLQHLVQGAETCAWGEVNDDTSLFANIWPRASAVAESLWSWQLNVTLAQDRLIWHRCYDLVKRKIPAGPIRPDFCPYVYNVFE